MAKTYRKAQTMRGLDKCPPRWFRNQQITRPLRRKTREFLQAVIRDDWDDRPDPATVKPWYT